MKKNIFAFLIIVILLISSVSGLFKISLNAASRYTDITDAVYRPLPFIPNPGIETYVPRADFSFALPHVE
jgi:hypothetical protein